MKLRGAKVSNFVNLLPVPVVLSCPFRVMLMRKYKGKPHPNLPLFCPVWEREEFAVYLACVFVVLSV